MSSTKKPRKSDKGSKPAVEEPKPSADKAQTQQPEAREVRLRPVEHYQLSAWLFMRGMGLVFLWAFASLYPQIRPLYSAEGVQPVYSHLQLMRDRLGGESKAAVAVPAIFWLSDSFGLDLDTFMYATAFVGMVGSALMLLGSSWTLLVSLVWYCYLSFTLVGQTFLSFQWDTLLIEAGFLAVLCSQMFTFIDNRRKIDLNRPEDGGASASTTATTMSMMAVRWLLFRLMFAAGAVKLSSECPKWWSLTALDYHWWTQCLPHAGSWFVNAMSPAWINALGVFLTFVVEIFLPFWFYSPRAARAMRLISGHIQILFQLMIIATGNYGFFNWLTIVLCVSLFDDDHLAFLAQRDRDQKKEKTPASGVVYKIAVTSRKTMIMNSVTFATLVVITVFFITQMFSFKLDTTVPKVIVQMAMTKSSWFSNWLPQMHIAGFALAIFSFVWPFAQLFLSAIRRETGAPESAKDMAIEATKTSVAIIHLTVISIIIFFIFIVSVQPFARGMAFGRSELYVPAVSKDLYKAFEKFPVINSYGLFAQMTTKRPEIIIQGSDDMKEWKNFEFKYKPGEPTRMPPLVAPHQPRFDWQMWFAALGKSTSNPWLVNFMIKILEDSPAARSLLDHSPWTELGHPPKYVRASLYHYTFTRPDSAGYNETRWWRGKYDSEYWKPFDLKASWIPQFYQQTRWMPEKDLVKLVQPETPIAMILRNFLLAVADHTYLFVVVVMVLALYRLRK